MKIKEVIVVEGKHDTQKLKTFFDVDTLETHGLGLSKKQMELIKKVNSERGVILFLDPDSAGNKIRQRLSDAIPDVKHAFIAKDKCKTSKKVGIEHASYEDLKDSLEHLLHFNEGEVVTISYEEYLDLGLQGQPDSKELRKRIGNELFLGECNAKTLYKRLLMFQITQQQLKQLIEELHD